MLDRAAAASADSAIPTLRATDCTLMSQRKMEEHQNIKFVLCCTLPAAAPCGRFLVTYSTIIQSYNVFYYFLSGWGHWYQARDEKQVGAQSSAGT